MQRVARQINARVLTTQRVGQSCASETALFERVSQPYVREGQRTGALRFGDVRVMALAGALCLTVHAVAGFNNRSLRALVAGLLGTTHTSAQITPVYALPPEKPVTTSRESAPKDPSNFRGARGAVDVDGVVAGFAGELAMTLDLPTPDMLVIRMRGTQPRAKRQRVAPCGSAAATPKAV
jgi:hypothetical protein